MQCSNLFDNVKPILPRIACLRVYSSFKEIKGKIGALKITTRNLRYTFRSKVSDNKLNYCDKFSKIW
jgi:hypothetical protein